MDRALRQGALRAYVTAQAPRPGRSFLILSQRHFIRHQSSAPTIVQSSFWKSIIPKPFRPKSESTVDWGVPEKKSKEWNPATYFICMFILIGSMSIQMISLKKDFATFTRRAEVRIGLLREVVEKLQRGEEVDVEKTLGTGDAEKELEWEDVLRELERTDVHKNTKKTAQRKTPSAAPEMTESEPGSVSTPNTEATGSKTSYSNFF